MEILQCLIPSQKLSGMQRGREMQKRKINRRNREITQTIELIFKDLIQVMCGIINTFHVFKKVEESMNMRKDTEVTEDSN